MAAYRQVYDKRDLQADCQEPGSAIEYGLPLPLKPNLCRPTELEYFTFSCSIISVPQRKIDPTFTHTSCIIFLHVRERLIWLIILKMFYPLS